MFLVETVSLCSQGCPGIHHRPGCFCLLGAGTKGGPCFAGLCLAVSSSFFKIRVYCSKPTFPFPSHHCIAVPHAHQLVCFSGLGLSWGMVSWIFAYVFPWKNVFSFPGHRARGIADSYGNLNFEELPNCFQVIAQFFFNSSRVGVLLLLTTLN